MRSRHVTGVTRADIVLIVAGSSVLYPVNALVAIAVGVLAQAGVYQPQKLFVSPH
ncbi:hypothetical protein [Sodalis sp.]|uniref:hypothetical protein n=1 Tax=Sodalis sp. (in: enterobacteria) TaxID=1898979 RepID=UPI0038730917